MPSTPVMSVAPAFQVPEPFHQSCAAVRLQVPRLHVPLQRSPLQQPPPPQSVHAPHVP